MARTSSKVAIVSWTALGGFLPSVLVCSIGALAATAVDMSDPQNALTQILPGWFAPVFLLSGVVMVAAGDSPPERVEISDPERRDTP